MKENKLVLFYLLVLTIVGVYCWYFFSLTDNIPREDDYWLLSDFNGFYTEKSLWQQLATFFHVKNSHRFVPVYFLYAVILKFNGSINLHVVIVVGFILLLALVYLLSKPLKKKSRYFAIPILLIFLNPLCYPMTFFAEQDIQYMTLFLTMAACIYMITYRLHDRFGLTLLLALVCTFTFGNGLLIWIIGSILLTVKQSWRKLTIWVVAGAITFFLFFSTFHNSGFDTSPFDFLNYLDKFAVFVLSFPGGGMNFFPFLSLADFSNFPLSLQIAFVFRLILVFSLPIVCLVYTLRYFFLRKKTWWFSNSESDSFFLFSLGLVLFVVFSGGLAAIFRSNVGFGEGIAQRYRLFGQLFVVATYFIFIFYNSFSKNSLKVGLVSSFLYCFFSYVVFLPKAKNSMVKFTSSEQNILDHGETYIYGGYEASLEKEIDEVLLPSILEAKTYKLSGTKYFTENRDLTIDEKYIDYEIIDNHIFLEEKGYQWYSLTEKKFLLIKGDQKIVYLPLSSVSYFSKYFEHSGKLMSPLYIGAFEVKNPNFYLLTEHSGKVKITKLLGLKLKE